MLLVLRLRAEEGGVLGKFHAISTKKNCADDESRGNKYDLSARDLKDHISVLDIDHPGSDGLYGLRTLKITGDYRSSTGGKEIDVHGIDIESISPTRLRFWMVNHRPAIDSDGNQLDPKKVGANSTIEVFEHEKGSEDLEWVRTIFSEAVFTPNNLVATGDGGVLITNDHDSKTGAVSNFISLSLFMPSLKPSINNPPAPRSLNALRLWLSSALSSPLDPIQSLHHRPLWFPLIC
jgi:hypothetical protein